VGGCPGGVAGPKTLSSQATIDHKNKTNTQRYKIQKEQNQHRIGRRRKRNGIRDALPEGYKN